MRHFITLAAAAAAMALAGCSKPPEQMMVGKFHVSDYQCDREMDSEMQQVQESITKTTFVEHLKDHRLVLTENGVTKKGTWELLGQDMQLKYVLEGMKAQTMDVKEIASGHFTIVIEDAPNSYTYITYSKD